MNGIKILRGFFISWSTVFGREIYWSCSTAAPIVGA